MHVENGVVREVVYVGVMTRYVVDLDAGAQVVVVRQNLERSSDETLADRGRRVQLAWRPEHTVSIESLGREDAA